MNRKPMQMVEVDQRSTRHPSDNTRSTEVRQRLLLVDDDDLVRGALEILLGDQYDVETAASAEAAFAGFTPGRFDLLITDLRLPGRHGHQLARALRGIDPHLPTMLITGEDLLPDDDRLEGFDTWLQKPFFNLDHVLDRVAATLGESRLRRAG